MSILPRLLSSIRIPHNLKFRTPIKINLTNKKTRYATAGLLVLLAALSVATFWSHRNTRATSRTTTHTTTQKTSTDLPSTTPAAPVTATPTPPQQTSTTTTPQKVATTTQAPTQQSTSSKVVIAQTITLGLGGYNMLHFTTQNFSSPSYLAIIHPVQSTHYTADKITSEGLSFSSSPYGSTVPVQLGSLILDTALDEFMSAGEVYTVTICANVNGSCGLSSNTVTATITQIAPPHS